MYPVEAGEKAGKASPRFIAQRIEPDLFFGYLQRRETKPAPQARLFRIVSEGKEVQDLAEDSVRTTRHKTGTSRTLAIDRRKGTLRSSSASRRALSPLQLVLVQWKSMGQWR